MESYIDKVQIARLENGFIPNEEKGEKAVGGRFFIADSCKIVSR